MSTPPTARRAVRPSFLVWPLLAAVAAAFTAGPAGAAPIAATTADGRRVLLNDDRTWQWADAAQSAAGTAETAPLELVSRKDVAKGCRFGLRLTNELGYEIKSLVPQFTAFTEGGVAYQTVFQSFYDLKPTVSQYQEIEFRGIDCGAIVELRVSGGDRCTMGELTKFSPDKGVCLSHVRPLASDIVPFSK